MGVLWLETGTVRSDRPIREPRGGEHQAAIYVGLSTAAGRHRATAVIWRADVRRLAEALGMKVE